MASEVTKPDFSFQWSSGGAIVAPSNVKIQTGWTAEVPPFQWENWSQNRQDNAILHLFQKGISVWDAASNYYFTVSGIRSYVQGSNGVIYVAVQSSLNQNPVTDISNVYWKIAFADNSTALTITSGDARYTQRSNNLSDVASIPTSRTNLSVYSKAEIDAQFPLGYFYGFTLKNNVTLPNTTVDVAAGQAKTSDNLFTLSLLSSLSGILQSSGSWTAGNNQNKLDTGTKAISTTYQVFVIRKTSDGSADILFSLSATAPTMPSGYASFRRIARIATDASGNIRAFLDRGNGYFDWVTPSIEITASAANPATSSLTLTGLGGSPSMVKMQLSGGGDGISIRVTPIDITNALNNAVPTTWTGGMVINAGGGSAFETGAGEFEVQADATGSVTLRTFTTTGALDYRIIVFGWREGR